MKTVAFFLVLVAIALLTLVLYGCGGETFTTAETLGVAGTPDDGAAASTGGAGTGGAAGTTGGASSSGGHATGGQVVATGGSDATGGAVASTGGVAPMATGGAPEVDAGCALVTHENGAGQTWQDCVPFGMHTEEQALKACQAWSDAVGGSKCGVGSTARCGDALSKVSALDGAVTFLMEWRWQGPNTGKLTKGAGGVCDVVGFWN